MTPATIVRAKKLYVLTGVVAFVAGIVMFMTKFVHGPVGSAAGLVLGICLMAQWPLEAAAGERPGFSTTLMAALGVTCTIFAARDIARLLF